MASNNSFTNQLSDTLTNLLPSLPEAVQRLRSTDESSDSNESNNLNLSSNALKMQNRRNNRLIQKLKKDLESDSFPEYKRSISSRIDRLIRKIRMNMDLLEARENGHPVEDESSNT